MDKYRGNGVKKSAPVPSTGRWSPNTVPQFKVSNLQHWDPNVKRKENQDGNQKLGMKKKQKDNTATDAAKDNKNLKIRNIDSPHALQTVLPSGSRRHRGLSVTPQLTHGARVGARTVEEAAAAGADGDDVGAGGWKPNSSSTSNENKETSAPQSTFLRARDLLGEGSFGFCDCCGCCSDVAPDGAGLNCCCIRAAIDDACKLIAGLSRTTGDILCMVWSRDLRFLGYLGQR